MYKAAAPPDTGAVPSPLSESPRPDLSSVYFATAEGWPSGVPGGAREGNRGLLGGNYIASCFMLRTMTSINKCIEYTKYPNMIATSRRGFPLSSHPTDEVTLVAHLSAGALCMTALAFSFFGWDG